MSMIGDLLKTPAEVREEELNKLRKLGQLDAAPLQQLQGKYSAAPQIFGGWGASLLAKQREQADFMARGLGEAAGQVGKAAGQAGLLSQEKGDKLAELGRTAFMSDAEKQAEKTQGIMQGIAGSKDKEGALRQASLKAFEAGNAKLGMALETKADELAAAKAEAERKQQELQLKINAGQRDEERLGLEGQRVGQAADRLRIDFAGLGLQRDKFNYQKQRDTFLDNQTTETLSAEEIQRFGLPEGTLAQRGPKGKLNILFEGKNGGGAEVKNVVWAEKPDGTAVRTGVVDGKQVEITADGVVPLRDKIRPVQAVQRVDDPTKAWTLAKEDLEKRIAQPTENLQNLEVMRTTLDEARSNPKAFGTFKRSFVKLTGPDSQISQLEINQATGGGDLATRVMDSIKTFVEGTPTDKSLDNFEEVLQVVEQVYANRVNNKIDTFLKVYNEAPDETLRQAANTVANSYLGDDDVVNRYLQEARGMK